ncbi:MAG TPA: tRNA pseudouridine(38-40) synthase TruA [Spirochaetaceae bacterium]|jgi:tRNA pseudouridine38-40 synthase|nr:tRNA pseudouridine(38-40) synthase TruA [Spirochaetaceae bacterium]
MPAKRLKPALQAGATRNLLAVLAYDGTDFKGWQRLPGAQRSVQESLETALGIALGEPCNAVGAGRTDAGVHARGQAANFWTRSTASLAELADAINAELPPDMRCLALREALPNFNARYRAVSKTYAYRFALDKPDTFWRRYSLELKKKPRLERIEEACALLPGTRSFKAFTNAKKDGSAFVRSLSEARLERDGPFLDLVFRADGFLYNQVRLMAAALLQRGLGRLSREDFASLLEDGKRSAAPGALGAFGLRLVSADYREEDFLGPLEAAPGALLNEFLGGVLPLPRGASSRRDGPRSA